ncbi:MAG: hypothetical protein CSA55_03890 [Ilumatobacter coccineus]|uniref:Thioester domain-containing protein n=1 Tax=Ilumatobacter coccineus TaxID=467094 RepID=A0A2G6K977_9ACTN|nr:MAG: hypothetical protein CSA55_03890 [Ilumatobacter coccineus]
MMIALIGIMVGLPAPLTRGATLTASYVEGGHGVRINGYLAGGLGTYRLTDGSVTMLALCIEADERNSTEDDAYQLVENRVISPELDTLLFLLDDGAADENTAIAAAALAWYYSDAQRLSGGPVWSDPAHDLSPISPTSPEPWEALAPSTPDHPIGFWRDEEPLDHAEVRLAELHRQVTAWASPWQLTAEPGGFRLYNDHGPIAGQPISITHRASSIGITDEDGLVTVDTTPNTDTFTITATAMAPGIHREWDGAPGLQRMTTASHRMLSASITIPATTSPPTTIPPSTSPPTTIPPTTIPPSTSRPTTIPPTTIPTTTTRRHLFHRQLVLRTRSASPRCPGRPCPAPEHHKLRTYSTTAISSLWPVSA